MFPIDRWKVFWLVALTYAVAVSAHAQVTAQPFVVGQGAFEGNTSNGWIAFRGDAPAFAGGGWRQLPWPDYVRTGGAVHPAVGDVDGDGRDEYVLGVGTGGQGWIGVLDDATQGYRLLKWIQVPWETYNIINGEVFPAVGDVDGDGYAEIVAGLGPFGGGWLAIYEDSRQGFALLATRRVEWPNYSEGPDGRTHVAVADLTGDGACEIIVGLGPGSNGWIEILHDAAGKFGHRAWVQLPWPSYNFGNGTIYPAAGDLDGDGRAEIVAGLGRGGAGWLAVIGDERMGYALRGWTRILWSAYNATVGETHPAIANVDDDPAGEILVGVAPYPNDGGWFAILDDMNKGAAHVAWRNLDWPAFKAAGGATYPAAGHRHLVTLTNPVGGEQWTTGSTHQLRWIADAALSSVRLEYSLDNGATWDQIATTTATGSYSWTIPDMPGRLVQLRVTDAASGRWLSVPKTIVVLRNTSALWQLVTSNPAWTSRDGVGAFVFNGRMWLEGGWHPFNQATAREIWSSADGAAWTKHADGPWAGTHVCGCVVFNNKMWIIGGNGVPDVWVSSNGTTWTRVLENGPWGHRYKPYVVVHDGKIWLMGGFDTSGLPNATYAPFNDVWSSPDGVTWTRVLEHAPWAPRGAIHGAAVLNGKIWIIGGGQYPYPGSPTERYFNDVWSSPNGVDWTLVTPGAPWPARLHHNVMAYADKLWVFAGHNTQNGAVHLMNDVWVSSDGVIWTKLAGTPWSPRHAAVTLVHNESLWLMAGFLDNARDVWRLQLPGNVSINGGAATTSGGTVTLALSPPDPSTNAMQFSNDGVSWSPPEVYSRTRAGWTLTPGPGVKTVYVRFRTASGTWSTTYSDTIVSTGS